jgi:hypothetical protein
MVVDQVISHAAPGEVVIMHLGGPNAPASDRALKEIVPILRESGYNFGILR